MKSKIIQLLSDSSEQLGRSYENRCIHDNDFEDIAECILKIIKENQIDETRPDTKKSTKTA